MRVTSRMTFDQAALNGGRARERLLEATREASTGQRVTFAEDDPGAAGNISRLVGQSAQASAIDRALGTATDELGAADAAFDGISTALSRARELAVQLSNSTYSAPQRAAAAQEIDGLTQHVIGLLNTKTGSRYLFGGHQDAAPPFDTTGGYLGDTGVRQVEVAPGVLVGASVRADVALKGVGGGVDVLGTLTALSAALSANNVGGVQATLPDLDTGIGQVGQARSELGGHLGVMQAASAATQTVKLELEVRRGHLADADIIDAATRLAQAEQALNASLTASVKSFGLSLLDKL